MTENSTGLSMVERMARAIIGPRNPVPADSPYTLEQLREESWRQSTQQERDGALWSAQSALRELREPYPGSHWLNFSDRRLRDYCRAIDAAIAEHEAAR